MQRKTQSFMKKSRRKNYYLFDCHRRLISVFNKDFNETQTQSCAVLFCFVPMCAWILLSLFKYNNANTLVLFLFPSFPAFQTTYDYWKTNTITHKNVFHFFPFYRCHRRLLHTFFVVVFFFPLNFAHSYSWDVFHVEFLRWLSVLCYIFFFFFVCPLTHLVFNSYNCDK